MELSSSTEQSASAPGITSLIKSSSLSGPRSSFDGHFVSSSTNLYHRWRRWFFGPWQYPPLTLAPGGLYFDVWLLIIDLFKKNRMMLLSFALTCRTFREYAQDLINKLSDAWEIDPTTYQDLNELAAAIDSSAQNGKCISRMSVESPKPYKAHEIAFSTIPVKLSNKLSKINTLHIIRVDVETYFHPSTWRLYGCAFSTTTQLNLFHMKFSSFVDFASLITSFSTLSSLSLDEVSCRSYVVPLSIIRAPKKCKLKLRSLKLEDIDTRFISIFGTWFAQIGGRLTGSLETPFSIFLFPRNGGICKSSKTEIEKLIIDCNNLQARDIGITLYQNLNKLQLQSTSLETIYFSVLTTRTVVLVNLTLPFIIKHINTLVLQHIDLKSISDLNSSAWAILDILLSAIYFRQYMSNNIQISIDLSFSSSCEEIAQSYFDGSQKKMMRSLFPLTTSLGEDIWIKLEEK